MAERIHTPPPELSNPAREFLANDAQHQDRPTDPTILALDDALLYMAHRPEGVDELPHPDQHYYDTLAEQTPDAQKPTSQLMSELEEAHRFGDRTRANDIEEALNGRRVNGGNGRTYPPPLLMEHIDWGPGKSAREPDTTVNPLSLKALSLIVEQNAQGGHALTGNGKAHSLYGIIRTMNAVPGATEVEKRKGYKPPYAIPKKLKEHKLTGTHLLDMFSATSETAAGAGTVLSREALDLLKAIEAGQHTPKKRSYYIIKANQLRERLNDMHGTVPSKWEVGEDGHARPAEDAEPMQFGDFLIRQFYGGKIAPQETFRSPKLRAKAALAIGSVSLARTIRPKLAKHWKEVRDEIKAPYPPKPDQPYYPPQEALLKPGEPRPDTVQAVDRLARERPDMMQHLNARIARWLFPREADLNYFWYMQERLRHGEKPADTDDEK